MQQHRRTTIFTAILFAMLLVPAPAAAQQGGPQGPGGIPLAGQNVIIIVADDVGVDVMEMYGEAGACSVSGEQCFKLFPADQIQFLPLGFAGTLPG